MKPNSLPEVNWSLMAATPPGDAAKEQRSILGGPSRNEWWGGFWEQDAIVSEDRMGSPEALVIMTWRYQLSESGQRLRATERIRVGGRDQDNVWEFARQ